MTSAVLADERVGPALAAAVAAYGLRGARAAFPSEPLGPAAWGRLVAVARTHRLTGLLGAAVADGELPVTAEQEAEAYGAQLDAAALCLVLERALLRAVDVLDLAGVPVRVLKGPAYAQLVYPDPIQRPFGDIDLLVPAGGLDDACRQLGAHGYRRMSAPRRRGFDRRFGKGATFIGPDGLEVDLHRTLSPGPFGLQVRLSDLWAGGQGFTVGERHLVALDPPVRFLHACFHAMLGDWPRRWVALRDVAQTALDPGVDADEVAALAEAWRARAVVARALHESWDALGVADRLRLHHDAERYRPSKAEARYLDLYASPARHGGALELAALRAVRGLPAKASFVLAHLAPSREFRAYWHTTRRERWRRSLRMAARGARE